MIGKIEAAIQQLRQNKPVVLNLTNFVTMDVIANCLLAVGAAPIMSVCSSELEELVIACAAVNINIGTLDNAFMDSAKEALELARKYNKPVVLDPVGAGATKVRTEAAQALTQYAAVIRGNASEIIAVGGAATRTKGVDSVNTTDDAKQSAVHLARHHQCTVVVSGPVDFITDGLEQAEVPYGSSLMTVVTGMGCALTAVIAAFRAVMKDSYEASVVGSHYFALCGEMASKSAAHPGTFKIRLIDCLHAADYTKMRDIYANRLP